MYNTTKEILLNTPVPMTTNTYKAVSHQQLIDLTLNSVEKAGFSVDKETYSTAKDGSVANGRYTIKNIMDTEMQLEIGWQNSYDKTLSLKFAIGTRILVCSNGCVHGEMGAFKKKHSGDVQEFAPAHIMEYIKGAGDIFQQIQKERDRMKEIELSKRTKAELIGRMFIEETFVKSTQINILAKEIENPSHDYGAPDSMWELYNFTTFSMKGIHPSLWMNQHMEAHKWFVNESGIIQSSPKIVVPSLEPPSPFIQLEMFNDELGQL